jgi:hypothetical protein
MSCRPVFAAAVIAASTLGSAALAYEPELAGAPGASWRQASSSQEAWGPGAWGQETVSRQDWSQQAPRQAREAPDGAYSPRRNSREGGECYAKVKFGAQYAPPPTGPEYVWTQAPGPPGSPGPIWCLTVQPLPQRPVMISPERYGWVRVLCSTDATPDRISTVQRRLYDRGMYRGAIDGRYDAQTAYAVRRFQSERHIEDRGYLSYQTLSALEVPPPRPVYWRRPTTFDTGVLDWPGKTRF